MAEIKWIKITTDIFSDEKIRLIEQLPDGDTIIVIWFKLLCMAGRSNNNGIFVMANDIPYTDEMLSTVFERPLNTVRLAISTFEAYGMIDIIDDIIMLVNWEKHQNIEGLDRIREQNRIRKQRERERKKLLLTDKNQEEQTSHVKSRDSHATEERRKKKEERLKNSINTSNFFEEIWKLYPKKKGKAGVSDKQKQCLFEIGINEMKRCIERYKADTADIDSRYIMYGSTFFNTGYIDYLDENYVPEEHKKAKSNNRFHNLEQHDTDYEDMVWQQVEELANE